MKLRAWVACAWALVLMAGAASFTSAQACTGAGCLSAGPRLASVSSARGLLLNALLNTLGGGNINLTVTDWNTIAAGDVSLARTLSALQATTNASTPAAALTANATVAQVVGAMATAAQQDGLTSLAASLGALQTQASLPSSIRLGDLLTSNGVLGTTRINALAVVSGVVQLYNYRNVVTTPQAITLSGGALGLSGVLNSVQLQAQVVEPPVYVCGPVGSAFHSAAIRVKLHLDLVSIALNLGVVNTSANVGQLDLYLEIARADGVLGAIDAIVNALTVQVSPGVVDAYLGTIADNVFFNRSRALVGGDVTPGNIGTLRLLGTTVSVMARSIVHGQSPSTTTLNFSGAGVQTRTAYTTAGFGANLFGSLVDNLQLSLSPTGVLDALLSALAPVLTSAVKPVLTTLLSGLVDPLLELMGIRLGEVDVSSGGTVFVCTVSGTVYQDANHNARQDGGETGTGTTLYAKLIATAAPTIANAVVAIDPATGGYAFPSVTPAAYFVVVTTDATTTQVTPAVPAGWIATETPTLSRSVTITTADATQQRFGLYHGSRLSGAVFRDNGVGAGGIAHNAVRDGSETAISGAVVNLTDPGQTTTFDTARTDASGAYSLWVPFSTNGAALKVTQPSDPTIWISVSGSAGNTGGSYALVADAVTFTHVSGSLYNGVNFGDVPVNRFDSDGQRVVAPGTTVLFPHVFHSGSTGQATFAITPHGALPAGWTAIVFRDAGCDGHLDTGDAAIVGPVQVVAEQDLCLVVKVFAPAEAAFGARVTLDVGASFAYTGTSLSASLQRQDVTTIAGANGLQLVKTVDRTTAVRGDFIVYTLTFVNDGAAAVTALKIRDATPAFTAFASAGCGTLPAGLSCSVTLQPGTGSAGGVEWTLTGNLPTAASGSVSMSVKLN